MKISVIVPVYNEKEALSKSYSRLKTVMDGMACDYELVFVNDGSIDGSKEILEALSIEDKRVKVAHFSRNFGHQSAVSAGLKLCVGDCAVIIDCDLQDPPELIPQMVELWQSGSEIVYGKREKRKGESLFKKMTAKAYYRLVKKLGGDSMQVDVGDFRLIDRKVIDVLNSMNEHNKYFRGLNCYLGFKQTPISYNREPRMDGETKYTMKKMVKLAGDGIISSSNKPLSIALKMGTVLTVISSIFLFTLLLISTFHVAGIVNFAVPTVYYIVALLSLFLSVLMFFVGVLGVYIGRILDECRNRAEYIITSTKNFDEA